MENHLQGETFLTCSPTTPRTGTKLTWTRQKFSFPAINNGSSSFQYILNKLKLLNYHQNVLQIICAARTACSKTVTTKSETHQHETETGGGLQWRAWILCHLHLQNQTTQVGKFHFPGRQHISYTMKLSSDCRDRLHLSMAQFIWEQSVTIDFQLKFSTKGTLFPKDYMSSYCH